MQLINETLNHDDQSMYSDSRPHNCDESQGDGEVKLACGCMLPVVVGAFSHEGVPERHRVVLEVLMVTRSRS